MDFIRNPDLLTFRQNWPGNPREGKRYREYSGEINTGLGKVARYMLKRNPQANEKRTDTFAPPTKHDDIHQAGDWVCWLGHACFLIQLDGVRYLTDPVWHDLSPLLRRRVAAPYTPQQIVHIDYLLISHDHRDHCDAKTIKQLSAALEFTVLAPLGTTDLIAPWLLRDQRIIEAGWYQRFSVLPKGQPAISFMPTQHWCRRYLHDMNRRLWGSFVLQGASRTVWFGGDSAASPHFAEVAEYFSKIDLAMIGIGAYKPAWFMQSAHTSPEQAWEGFEASGAKQLYPMHYGTYDLSQEPASEPIRLLKASAKTAGRSGDVVGGVVGEVVLL